MKSTIKGESITVHADKYCVYKHSIGDRLIYIGAGKGPRLLDTQDRGKLWKIITDGYPVTIEVIAWFDDKQGAMELEKELIMKHIPEANITHTFRRTNKPYVRQIEAYKLRDLYPTEVAFMVAQSSGGIKK